MSLIKNGEQTSREPEYSQKGASRTGNDYGNTYVEINLTAQHLYFYVKGKLVVQSDFVSGNAAKGWSTPAGAYSITYKQRNATLKGQGYATPVSYWMPFNGGIGLHDANWRKTFGWDDLQDERFSWMCQSAAGGRKDDLREYFGGRSGPVLPFRRYGECFDERNEEG